MKDIGNTQLRKSLRINVEFDHAEKLAWSPDSRAILIYKCLGQTTEVYKVDKKEGWFSNPSKGKTFKQYHSDDIIGFGISCTGRYMITCSKSTDLVIWDCRGNILEKLDTSLIKTYCAKISPCGRFVVASGFIPDVRVYEVQFAKIGEFQKVERVFELTGHNSGVYDVAFDQDSSHMATVCKDGNWRLFDTRIEYKLGQSPKLLMTAKYEKSDTNHSLIALSLNAEVVAIATDNSVYLYNAFKGILDHTIEDIYTGGISAMSFDYIGKSLLTAGDRQIRIFHNVTGYKVALAIAKENLQTTKTNAMRDRLEQQIEELEELLKNFA